MNRQFHIGQLVRLSLPQTYGFVSKVIQKPIKFHQNEKVLATFNSGGLAITYMEPVGFKTYKSVYPFESKTFNHVHVVKDPGQEIKALEAKLKQSPTSSEEAFIRKAIEYIQTFTNPSTQEVS